MISKKIYTVLSLLFAILFVLTLTSYVALEYFHVFGITLTFTPIIFVFALIGLGAGFFYSFARYTNIRLTKQTLLLSNRYSFGVDTVYFNRAVFENIVRSTKKRKKYHKMKQTMIAFSGIDQSVSFNNSRKYSVLTFNYKVMSFLDDYFVENKMLDTHYYCFDQGTFFIYTFGDSRMDVVKLVNIIHDELYKIVEENNIHILVTPYFGIDEIKHNESLVEAFDHAIVAKNVSRKNFDTINFYREALNDINSKDETLEIIHGLENDEFLIYYQPKFDIVRNRFISAEALVRWNHPTKGLLFPDNFMPQIESADLSHELDIYVFKHVCMDLSDAKKKGRRLLPVSVNFSLYEFYSLKFLDFIAETLEEYKVDPRLIQIEILETSSQANPFIAVSVIKKLREKGIKVLMDDFGVGYSNLGNLLKIPFDAIKIDKSYIFDLEKNKKSRQIVQCIVDLGNIANLEVIAEGVDNEVQVELLKRMGCDTIQGFYYSKGIAKEEYYKFLKNNPFEQEGGRE